MSPKTRNIIGWILSGLLAALFLMSAVGKFFPNEEAIKGTQAMGVSLDTLKILGAVEVLSVILLLVPRTGIAGILLLIAYTGGIMATHLTHGLPMPVTIIIQVVIWITAAVRFPELTRRLTGKAA